MLSTIEDGVLTVYPEGRIDSASAEKAEAAINGIIADTPHDSVILDAEKLEYISSAGLRVILRLRKAEPRLKIVNASSEVYEIFDMTGFTDMLPVEKAYRMLSVDGCEVIGQGSNGKVYRLDPDTIIKVYFDSNALPDIRRERELARKAFVMGIPTAIPYDVVKVGDTYGSVFELLNAKSFAKLIVSEPENKDKYIQLYVDLLKKIHGTQLKPGDMPDMKAVALNWAGFMADHLPEDQYKKLYALVEAVPENDHMVHGDYHMKNVMMQGDEVLLIDMDTLCMGDPVFEFASIFLAYVGFGETDPTTTEKFLGIPYSLTQEIWGKTLKLYFDGLDDDKIDSYAEKSMIIGYTRLMRRTIRRNGYNTEEGKRIIGNCKTHLAELLAKVDSLCFD